MIQRKIRDSNIELLRIISILMIIAGHYYVHGNWDHVSNTNTIFLKVVGGYSKVGVACFILISGYYGDKIKPGRIVSLVFDRWIYSFILTITLLIIGATQISAKLVIHTTMPILTCRHNYITTFCMLYLFVPFLNKIIDSFPRKALEAGIGLSTILFSLFPTIYSDFAYNTYSYILWMMFLYVIGRCLNKFDYNLPWKIILVMSTLIVLICFFIIEPMTSYNLERIVNMQYSIIVLAFSVSLFMVFSGLKIQSKIINWIAKSTFAVYIIHDDPYVRAYIWNQVLRNSEYGMSKWLPIHFLISVFIVYIGCILIDKLLRATLFKAIDKLPLLAKVESIINKAYDCIMRF